MPRVMPRSGSVPAGDTRVLVRDRRPHCLHSASSVLFPFSWAPEPLESLGGNVGTLPMEDRHAEPGNGLQGKWWAGCPSTGQDVASSFKAASCTHCPRSGPGRGVRATCCQHSRGNDGLGWSALRAGQPVPGGQWVVGAVLGDGPHVSRGGVTGVRCARLVS